MADIISSFLIASLCTSQNHSRYFMKCVVTAPFDHWPIGQELDWGKPMVAREISSMWGLMWCWWQNSLKPSVSCWNLASTDVPSQIDNLSTAPTKLFAIQCFPAPRCTLCQISGEKKCATCDLSIKTPSRIGGVTRHGSTFSIVSIHRGCTEKSS